MPERHSGEGRNARPPAVQGYGVSPPPSQRGSNCVADQAVATAGGRHGAWSRSIAFSIVRSFRIQATSATFFALRDAQSRR